MLRDIFSYKGKINSLSLRGPDALQILVLNPGPVSAAVQGQHGRGAPRIPIMPRQRHARGGQTPRCRQCCLVPVKAAQPWGAPGGLPFAGGSPSPPRSGQGSPVVTQALVHVPPPPPPSTAGTAEPGQHQHGCRLWVARLP